MANISCDATGQFFLNPYKLVIKSRIINGFNALNRGDYHAVTALFAENVHYWFSGDSAVGGERGSRKACEAWFVRLLNLLPGQFSIKSMQITGMPWKTTVITQFQDVVTPQLGSPYTNDGIQVICIRWGKAVSVRTYVDTLKVSKALRYMAENGVVEAAAQPIQD
jgi:ketosteroid isomerase-like protein